MRPTREGKFDGKAPGLIFKGYGVDPGVTVDEPDPPTDRTGDDDAVAYIPVLPPPTLGAATDLNLQFGTDSDGGGTRVVVNPTYANDGTTATQAYRTSYYKASGGTHTWWLKADLGSAQQVDEIVVRGGFGNAGENDPTWVLYWSDDGSSWTAASYSYAWNGATSPRTATLTLSASQTRRYWRLGQNVTWTGLVYPVHVHTWAINGPQTVDPTEVFWVEAPLSIDDDAATYEEVDEDSVDATGNVIWRATLADSYLIASIEASIGFATAGNVTVTVQAGNEENYSDAATVATVVVAATGSLTADDVDVGWAATDVFRYWQLVIDAADAVRVYEVALLDPPTFTGAHVDLTGRDAADQHPADAVTVTPFAAIAATNVQDALEEIVAEAGSTLTVDDGTTSVSPVDTIVFDGATVTDDTGGQVTVEITGGAGGAQAFIGVAAYNSTTQSLADNTLTNATFDSEEFDSDGFHSTGADLTVPAGLGGKYMYGCYVSFDTADTDFSRQVSLRKNGTTVQNRTHMPGLISGPVRPAISLTGVIDMAAGDALQLACLQNSGSSLNIGDASNAFYRSRFWMFKLDSGKVGSGIGARAYNSTTQSVNSATATVMTLDTEEFDTDGFHSTSVNTGRMTIPTGLGGLYVVTGGTYFGASTAGSYRIVAFRKNGTTDLDTSHRISPKASATADPAIHVATVVSLAAGDYVELISYQDSGGALSVGSATASLRTHLAIARLDSGSGGPQSNYAATTSPSATDDAAHGYTAGSRWLNTTTGVFWTCVVATTAAARWVATVNPIPAVSGHAGGFSAGTTSLAITTAAFAVGANLVFVVCSTARKPNAAPSQTNVTWTERYASSGNNAFVTVYTGVVAGGASGTTLTTTFASSTAVYAEVVRFDDSPIANFTACAAADSATAATTALSTVAVGGMTPGGFYMWVVCAGAPTSSYSGLSQAYRHGISVFGGQGRMGVFRAQYDAVALWSLSSSAVNYFAVIVRLT